MTLFTRSKWYYGHNITADNRTIDFFDDGIARTASLRPRSYSLTGFVNEIARSMNLVSPNTYTTTLNRSTRKITISSTVTFSLLPVTGPTNASSALPLAGFNSDVSSATTYQGEPSGKVYMPQLKLQDYNDFDRDQDAVGALVNTSSSGRVESVTFGTNKFMTCNIRYVTDKKTGFMPYNQNAVSELIDFMEYIARKFTTEFIPDIDNASDFTEVVLESTSRSSTGTGFRLSESDQIPGFYDSGRLTFRQRIV